MNDIEEDISINSFHYNMAANQEAANQRHKHLGRTKNVAHVIWDDKTKISDDFNPYYTKFTKMTTELEAMYGHHMQRTEASLHII